MKLKKAIKRAKRTLKDAGHTREKVEFTLAVAPGHAKLTVLRSFYDLIEAAEKAK